LQIVRDDSADKLAVAGILNLDAGTPDFGFWIKEGDRLFGLDACSAALGALRLTVVLISFPSSAVKKVSPNDYRLELIYDHFGQLIDFYLLGQ
jgi:hypothetical protein